MVEYFYHYDYLRGAVAGPGPNAATKNSGYIPPHLRYAAKSQKSKLKSPTTRVYLIEHAKVFAIAVKYQIDGLRDLAASKFEEAAAAHWNNDDFPHAVHVAYNSTADQVTQLRKIVADTLHERLDDLAEKAEVETVVRSIPGLAYDLLKRRCGRVACFNGHTASAGRRHCSNCVGMVRCCSHCLVQGFSCPCPDCGYS